MLSPIALLLAAELAGQSQTAPAVEAGLVAAPSYLAAPATVLPTGNQLAEVLAYPVSGDYELILAALGTSSKEFDVGNVAFNANLGKYLTDRSLVTLRQAVGYTDFGPSVWNGSTGVAYDYHFSDEKLRPFVGVGVGYIYGDTVDETWVGTPEAGVKWYPAANVLLNFTAQYQFFFDSADSATSSFDDGAFSYFVGFGMYW
jgi:hypothetical protein